MNKNQNKFFAAEAEKIINQGQYRQLEHYIQHGTVTCMDHSITVARTSYALACRLGFKLDRGALIRGALLHDYFLYDWHDKDEDHRLHGFTHPAKALRNARRHFCLDKIEQDIIQKHMWPLTIVPPRYKESVIVCLVDKYCSSKETLVGMRDKWFGRKKYKRRSGGSGCSLV